MGDQRLRRASASLVGLFIAVAASSASAQELIAFRLLRLEGHQVRWQPPPGGAPAVVTYRVATESMEFPSARNCRRMAKLDDLLERSGISAEAAAQEIAAAFAMWEAAANIRFRQVDGKATADIVIGAQAEPEGWAFADVFYDASFKGRIKPISQSLVCLNPLRPWKVGFDGDLKTYDIRYTLAHEIGHAIGLDHPQGGGQIMGYRYEERFRTLQPGDVRGAVLLYGEPRQVSAESSIDPPSMANSPARWFAKRLGTRSFSPRSP